MLKCKCAECGITKTKFVKNQTRGNLPSIGTAIDVIQTTTAKLMPSSKPAFKDFWSGKTFERAGENIKRQFTKSKPPYKQITKKKIPGCESNIYKDGKWFNFGCPGSLTVEESFNR